MKNSEHTLLVQGTEITVLSRQDSDYISLTDMARHREASRTEITIQNWMRNRETVEFLGIWESLHNPNFKHIEFDVFKREAGLNAFVLNPSKWIQSTRAIGLITKKGKYGGGTFAHKDIAFEFGSWLSAPFKLYLIKEFQRLKEEESKTSGVDWDIRRVLCKANYRIQTDAIKETIIPERHVPKEKEGQVYASEADMINTAVFGVTAAHWKSQNPTKSGNIRDNANVIELMVLSNLESMNGGLIRDGMHPRDRFLKLSSVAVEQFKSLEKTKFVAENAEKTIFDPRQRPSPLKLNAPSIKPVDVKAKFEEMKRVVDRKPPDKK